MERNGKIYKVVNSVNNKVYIGSTQLQYLSKRMAHHRENCIKAPMCGKLYPAMIKFGFEKFNIVLLETIVFTDKEQLRAKEYEWISKLNTIKNGYNTMSKDGVLPDKSRNQMKRSLSKYYKDTNKDVGLYFREEKGRTPRWVCNWSENGKLKGKSFRVVNIEDTDKIKEEARMYRVNMINDLELYN